MERTYDGLPPDDNYKARRLERLKKSKPEMNAFFAWAAERAAKDMLPKSLLGQVIQYAFRQRVWLERVLRGAQH